jgi:heptosyltransferase-2
MSINPKNIKNILILRNDRFGEFLLNIPALRAVKETFSNARIIAVVDTYTKELAQEIAFIDEIIEWAKEKHSLIEKLKLIGILKKRRIDLAIMLNPSKEFNILTYLSGIPVRVGYARKWGFLLNHTIEDKKFLGLKHEIKYNLELVALIGAKTENKTLSLKADHDSISGLLKEYNITNQDNLIAVHPFTSDPLKQWPINNFIELIKRLARETKIIMVGGKEDSQKTGGLFDGLTNYGLINLVGKTTLKQLAALLEMCRLLISGDSGPVHLASCLGTPVLAIFRSDMPEKSSKRWGPLTPRSVVIEKPNLADISVEEVFNKINLAGESLR